jgi:ectoine hydroxylase-related dioxygenase (phytanoyl-CoA dioxygenase family)
MTRRFDLAALLAVVASLGSCNAFPLQHSFSSVRRAQGDRRAKMHLNVRKSKDEVSSIASSLGLQPVARSPKKKKQKQKQPSAKKASSSDKRSTGKVQISAQLDYSRNGSTVLRSFVDPDLLETIRGDLLSYTQEKELEAWRQKVEVGSNDPERAKRCRTIHECQKELIMLNIALDNLPFLQYFNTWRDVPAIEALCYQLGKSAALLLDVPSVRLYQDALFTKRSKDGPTPWHTDARMAPFDTSNMLTFWIPLQEVPKGGTGLIFVPKSHNDFALPFWNDFDGLEYARLEERYKDKTVSYMPLSVGDITVHSGWTLHCADSNESTSNRYALAISFVDARAEIRETAMDFSPSQGGGYGDNEDHWSYREWVSEIPARKEFGSHPLVPIVWPVI